MEREGEIGIDRGMGYGEMKRRSGGEMERWSGREGERERGREGERVRTRYDEKEIAMEAGLDESGGKRDFLSF